MGDLGQIHLPEYQLLDAKSVSESVNYSNIVVRSVDLVPSCPFCVVAVSSLTLCVCVCLCVCLSVCVRACVCVWLSLSSARVPDNVRAFKPDFCPTICMVLT